MAEILVTGSAGFIGSHLTCALLEEGHQVTGLDNINGDYDTDIKEEALERAKRTNWDNFNFIHGDIRKEGVVKEAMNGVDYVYHHAGKAGVPASVSEPDLYREINAEATVTLLKEAEEQEVERFVYASTSSVYGGSDALPYTEDQALDPVSPYGITKLSGERFVKAWNDLYGLNTVSLRYFTVYGEWMRTGMAIPDFTARAMEPNEPFIFRGDGSHTRDFTHVEDVVQANLALLNTDNADGEVLNIGSNNRVSVEDISKHVLDTADADKEIEYVEERPGDVSHTAASIEKAKRLIDYEPEVDIYDGVEKFVNWYRANRDWYHPKALEASR